MLAKLANAILITVYGLGLFYLGYLEVEILAGNTKEIINIGILSFLYIKSVMNVVQGIKTAFSGILYLITDKTLGQNVIEEMIQFFSSIFGLFLYFVFYNSYDKYPDFQYALGIETKYFCIVISFIILVFFLNVIFNSGLNKSEKFQN